MKTIFFRARIAILLLVPTIILINIFYTGQTEFWKGKYDPSYAYLLNGLNLATTGGNIGHIDHPGTTVQVSSAIIIKIVYEFRNPDDSLQSDLLHNPEYYLKCIAWTFTLINCLLIFLSGIVFYKLSSEITYGLLFQSFTLNEILLRHAFYEVKPEPVLLGAVILLMMVFLRNYYSATSADKSISNHTNIKKEYYSYRYVLLFGIIIGFCIATKINSIPLVIIPLLFINKLKEKIIYITSALFAFVVFTLPISDRYIAFLRWLKNIAFHSGYYGNGTKEIINATRFFENMYFTIRHQPFIIWVVLLSIIIIAIQISRKKYDRNLKILIVFVLVQLISFVMVFKHFRLHYLIPVIPTIAMNLFIMFQMAGLKKMHRNLLIIPVVILLFLFNIRIIYSYQNHKKIIKIENISNSKSDFINIYAYQCSSQLFALSIGDDYAKKKHAVVLENIYGKQYFYDYWSKKLHDWQTPVSLDSLRKFNKNLYFISTGEAIREYTTIFRLKYISEEKYLIEE